ncbi:hypothetical protein ACFL00_02210, partial [Pseudomonadota bacterium]
MNIKPNPESPCWRLLFLTCCTMLLSGLFFSTVAWAQAITPKVPAEINDCIETAADESLNCVSNDVKLGLLVVDDPQAGCTENPPDSGLYTADVKFQAELIAGAKERWDIGMYIALDGGDARTGVCGRNYLPAFPDPLAAYPGPADPTSGDGPHYQGDGLPTTNTCGDLPQGVPWLYDLLELDPTATTGGTPVGQAPGTIATYTIACVDLDNDGFVDVGTCTSWDNSDGGACTSTYGAIPNTKAKCNCERTNTTLVMPGFLTVVKACVPTNDPGLFDLKVDSDTWLSDANCGDSIKMAVQPGDYSVSEVAGTSRQQYIGHY